MSEKTIIEIHGVKMEVDLRHAKRIDHLKVGDPVKVLAKEYSEHAVHPGVVIGFEPFEKLPTIIVAYVSKNWSEAKIKFLYFNANTKDTEVIRSDDADLGVEKTEIINRMEREISKKQRDIDDIKEQIAYFETNFGVYWEKLSKPEAIEGA